jgi:hypothetical protein
MGPGILLGLAIKVMTYYDDVIMRTIIDLPEEQIQALDRWCRRDGISRAEAIRRAIAQTVTVQSAADTGQAFGLWRDRPVDGVVYQRRVRKEWERKPVTTSRRLK